MRHVVRRACLVGVLALGALFVGAEVSPARAQLFIGGGRGGFGISIGVGYPAYGYPGYWPGYPGYGYGYPGYGYPVYRPFTGLYGYGWYGPRYPGYGWYGPPRYYYPRLYYRGWYGPYPGWRRW